MEVLMAIKAVHVQPNNGCFFDLNIEKVLESWDIHHALREVIANAIDEQQLTKSEEIQIFKDLTAVWHVRDFGRGLKCEHLTQNENQEKLENGNLVIGRFGVGLKDALATFDRHHIELLIKSKYGDITIEKATKHSFEQLVTLHAVIKTPSEPEMRGTEFLFSNVRDQDIEASKSLFLRFSGETELEKTEYGEVILKQRGISRIYVNGLKVAEEENFLFSYNITSLTAAMRKALNRERTHVGRTAYTPRVKSILLACKTIQVGQRLITDLQEFKTGQMHDELKWIEISTHASRILSSSREKVMFMTSDQLILAKDVTDEAQNDGQQIIIVPDKVAEKISGLSDLSGRPIRNLSRYVEERLQSFKFAFIKPADLSEQEREVFGYTDKIFSLIGGRPQKVQEVLISETMRPGEHNDTTGLWNEGRQIIIIRSRLMNLEKYAATLLHVAGYALSGASPLSRKIENQLMNQLGMVAIRALQPTYNFSQNTPQDVYSSVKEEVDDSEVVRPTKRQRTSDEQGPVSLVAIKEEKPSSVGEPIEIPD